MHRLRIGGGVAGFMVAAGSMLIFLLGVPAFRPFLALSMALGIVIAVALQLLRRRKSGNAPLSLK